MGYDRFEGRKAWEALAQLYRVLRKYINFFQPSLKLIEKERKGAKVSKKYDTAKTPYQRILLSEHIMQTQKDALTSEYDTLDPVSLLAQMEALQDRLWEFSWTRINIEKAHKLTVMADDVINQCDKKPAEDNHSNRYYRSSKKIDLRRAPRTWRTRKDPFVNVWAETKLRLELMPEMTAKDVIEWLMEKYPNQFAVGQIRTMQRRIAEWRQEQVGQEQRLRTLMVNQRDNEALSSAISNMTNSGDNIVGHE